MNKILSELNALMSKMEEETSYLKKENTKLKCKLEERLRTPAPTYCPPIHRSMFFTPQRDPIALSEYSWETIKQICDSGMAPQLFSVGDTKTVTLKNGDEITVRIIGMYHDIDPYGQPIPITWELCDLWPERFFMNKSGTNKDSWEDTDMREWLHSNVRSMLPDELSQIIVPAMKLTRDGGDGEGMVETKDTLFLLSEQEIFGRKIYSKGGEGRWYEWYQQENVSYAKKYPDGSFGWRWERSPYGSNSAFFCLVISNGDANSNYASDSYGVSFGFCT